jgi:hypothetical protein
VVWLAALHWLSPESDAAPITYTFKGTANGSLGGVPFAGAQFTLSLFGDSTNVVDDGSGIYWVEGWASAIGVNRAGCGSFTTPKRMFANGWAVGFTRANSDGGFDLLDVQSASFSGYDLRSSFGVISNLTHFGLR